MQTVTQDVGDNNYFSQSMRHAPEGLGATRAALSKVLRSLDLVGWSRREDSGRLDRRSLSRYAVGDKSLFSRREYKEADTAAVSVMIDLSGSMGHVALRVQDVAIQLSLLLDKCRVPFAITGFSGDKSPKKNNGIITIVDDVDLFAFKEWGSSLKKCRGALGCIAESVTGGTPDYGALYLGIEDIAKRPEKRKILFILTDAEGYVPAHIEHAHKIADKLGVTIIALGIGSPEVEDVFRNAATIYDANEIGGAAFRTLLNNLRKS